MMIQDKNIDQGRAFDWGRTSADYAKYRDIYPPEFYQKIIERGLCIKGQNVLDLGTGTGVLPRNLYSYGARWTGVDIAENQIKQAKILSEQSQMDIDYYAIATEDIDFPDHTFDVVTACQCFWYFDHSKLMPKLARMLKPDGRLLVLYMAWLPFEDRIARASEELVLKYNPGWTGAGETRKPIHIEDAVYDCFEMVEHEEYDIMVPFTRESWHGRMRACRGVGASMTSQELMAWEKEHMELLEKTAPEKFEVLHYAALAELKRKSKTPMQACRASSQRR